MPAASYEAALGDPDFFRCWVRFISRPISLRLPRLLERAAKLQTAAGGQPSVALELTIAGIYLLRNQHRAGL